MTELVKSQLFHHGTKFIVTDNSEDGTYGPGTMGFISHVKGYDQDFPNVAYLIATIIRRGKTGKARIDQAELSTPIFDIEHEVLKENMPDEKRRFYVHIEGSKLIHHVNDMEDIDFVGYAFAVALFLFKLGSRAKHFKPWPQSNNSPLNVALHAAEMWSESEAHTLQVMNSGNFREIFMQRARLMESTLVKPSLTYMARVAALEEEAAKQLAKLGSKKNPIVKTEILSATIKETATRKMQLMATAAALMPSKKSK